MLPKPAQVLQNPFINYNLYFITKPVKVLFILSQTNFP